LEEEPLIHTSPPEDRTQNVVDDAKEEKCGLKYVIHSPDIHSLSPEYL
jgi:hypothetical protein